MTEPLKETLHEVEKGRDPKTPFLALTGVTIAVTIAVGVMLAIVALAYVLAS
jgi:hypothetical protein